MIYHGLPASPGYAIGRVYCKNEVELIIEAVQSDDPAAETCRLDQALEDARVQLREIREKISRELGEAQALIFDAHLLFLDDPEYMGAIREKIGHGATATRAVNDVSNQFIELFESLEDEYMRERAADLQDVARRLLQNLTGTVPELTLHEPDTVVVAHDLTPSDTAGLDKSMVIAFLTDVGGKTSHTAIMARTLEIPAVVGLGDITSQVSDGDLILVDGSLGQVQVNPPPEAIAAFYERKEQYLKEKAELRRLVDVPTTSRDGKAIEVAANIGRPQDVAAAVANGAEGIGLYRTEFLYMDRHELPSEEEQLEAYGVVLEEMAPRPVIIRTLDIGGDKQLPYLEMPWEMNPFLGYRAIRLCLDRPDLFKVQLRAMLRASVRGNLKVMFPMISGIGEYRAAMALVRECQKELRAQGHPFREDIEWGIMVEIPSVAVIADEMAKEVDFLSIGTNDLIQYTLAADRMAEKIAYLYDPFHPAVLRLIQMTIDGAHAHGKWCGMCGEMAGDPEAIPMLLAMGLDEFSMAAGSILDARRLILESDCGQMPFLGARDSGQKSSDQPS